MRRRGDAWTSTNAGTGWAGWAGRAAQAGAAGAAWRCGDEALWVGEALDDTTRQASTLPWVGQTMLQLLETHDRKDAFASGVIRRLNGLLGEGWEERLHATGPAT